MDQIKDFLGSLLGRHGHKTDDIQKSPTVEDSINDYKMANIALGFLVPDSLEHQERIEQYRIELREARKQIVVSLPDGYQKYVLVLDSEDEPVFDILEIIDKPQSTIVIDTMQRACRRFIKNADGELGLGLDIKHVKGQLRGKEVFSWFVDTARSIGSEVDDPYISFLQKIVKDRENTLICGHSKQELGLNTHEFEQLFQTQIARLIDPNNYQFAGDFEAFRLIIRIASKLPEGYTLIKAMIDETGEKRRPF